MPRPTFCFGVPRSGRKKPNGFQVEVYPSTTAGPLHLSLEKHSTISRDLCVGTCVRHSSLVFLLRCVGIFYSPRRKRWFACIRSSRISSENACSLSLRGIISNHDAQVVQHMPSGTPILSVSKGIETSSLMLMNDILKDMCGTERSYAFLRCGAPAPPPPPLFFVTTAVYFVGRSRSPAWDFCAFWVQIVSIGYGLRILLLRRAAVRMLHKE